MRYYNSLSIEMFELHTFKLVFMNPGACAHCVTATKSLVSFESALEIVTHCTHLRQTSTTTDSELAETTLSNLWCHFSAWECLGEVHAAQVYCTVREVFLVCRGCSKGDRRAHQAKRAVHHDWMCGLVSVHGARSGQLRALQREGVFHPCYSCLQPCLPHLVPFFKSPSAALTAHCKAFKSL
jgi:hypothetical protein